MATNATIPLAYKPAQVDDPGVVEQRKQSIAGMIQDRDLRDQALQEGIIKLQQAREEQDDNDKFTKIYIDNKGDPDKTISAAQESGVGPKTILDHQIVFDNQKRAALGLTADQRKMSDDNAARMIDLLEPIKKAKPEEKQAAWDAAKVQGKAQNLISPTTNLPDLYPGDEPLDTFLAHTYGQRFVNSYADNETKRRMDEGKASEEELERAANQARGLQSMTAPPAATQPPATPPVSPPPVAGPPPPTVAAPAPVTGQGPLAPVQRVSPAASTGTAQQVMPTVPAGAPLPAAPVGAPYPTQAQAGIPTPQTPAPVPAAPTPAQPPDIVSSTKAKYPFINRLNPVMIQSDKQGGEGWPIGEEGAPDYPRPSGIPIDRPGIQIGPGSSEDDIAGEVLHLDPFSNYIRSELTKTLTPQQIKYLKSEALDYGEAGGGTEEHRMQNAVDSLMRGVLVGQWPAQAIQKMNLDPNQNMLLGQLKKYMTGDQQSGAPQSAQSAIIPTPDVSGAGAPSDAQNNAPSPNDMRDITYQRMLASLPKEWSAPIIAKSGTAYNPSVVQGLAKMGFTPAQVIQQQEFTQRQAELDEARKSREQAAKDKLRPANEAELELAAGDPNSPYHDPSVAALALRDKAKAKTPTPEQADRMGRDRAVQNAFNQSGHDWNQVLADVSAGKYPDYGSDIADHASKMIKLNPKLTGDDKKRVENADSTLDTVQRAITGINDIVSKYPDLVGPAIAPDGSTNFSAALKRNVEAKFGSEPPEFGQLDSLLESVAALQPGQHGFRSVKAVNDFKQAMGLDPRTGKPNGSRAWLQNPDKAIQGLTAIENFNQYVRGNIFKENNIDPNSRTAKSASSSTGTSPAPVPANIKAQFPNAKWARDENGGLHHGGQNDVLPKNWTPVN